MKSQKNIFNNVMIVLFTFVFLFITNTLFAQIKENEATKPTVADTIVDDNENIIDSNATYKEDFNNLNGSGDWIQVTKGAVTSEMMDQTEDDITYSEDPLDSTDASQVVYVWRPYVSGPYMDWDPYCNGRWEFTYAGWIWISYYDWGWAPYNYGRWWCSSTYGWLWFPGRMWGANWCSWRGYNGYYGWHPRGPHIWWRGRNGIVRNNHINFSHPNRWKFVDKKNITSDINKTSTLNGSKNKEILKNSTNLSGNINKYNGSKNFSYNGPNANSISGVNGEKISPKQIVTSGSKEKTKVSGNIVTVYKNGNSNTLKKTENGAVTNNTSNTSSTSVGSKKSNASLQTSARNTKNVVPNNNNNKTGLYASKEFYKVQAKTNSNKVQNNASKVGNNGQRVNTNKTENNTPSNNNTNRTTTTQQKARVHSNNQNTTKTNSNRGSNNSGTVKRGNSNNGSRNNGSYGSRNSGNNGNRQSSPTHSSNNGSRSGRGGRK